MTHKLSVCFLLFLVTVIFQLSAQPIKNENKEVVLVNGIVLQKQWPPLYTGIIEQNKAMPIPYLQNPPKIIFINNGRQLFVDSFLIENTNLTFVNHQPVAYKNNPVLEPDKEWEYNKNGPYAMPFSDGVWYDERENKFKMWYLTGAGQNKVGLRTAYAESSNGVNWTKPVTGVSENTNIVDTMNRDCATIWLDKNEKDPSKRYKMFQVVVTKDNLWPMVLKYSADGIRWSNGVAQSGGMLDRSTVFYNPFLAKWILSMKSKSVNGRAREYLEHANEKSLVSLAHKVQNGLGDANIVPWFGADNQEPIHPSYPDIKPQIYNHDAIAYESIMLGYFVIWQGPENDQTAKLKIQKRNEVLIGYSRDGFHWSRPSHLPFIGVNPIDGAWNWGNVQSVAGVPIIKGDSLYFYASGRRLSNYSWDSYSSVGLYQLRRDGFVSMNTNKSGYLLTKTVMFKGNYFFVNADVKGELAVELQDSNGRPIPGFTKSDCIKMKGSSTKYLIRWANKADVSLLKNKEVKIKFYLTDGDIYSFWVSNWKTGESNGYTAGGGPGLNSKGTDTR